MPARRTFESLNEEFSQHNVKVLRGYKNLSSPCFFLCPCGNEFFTKPYNIQRGQCTKCLTCEYQEFFDRLAGFGINLLVSQKEYRGKEVWYQLQCHCKKVWRTKIPFVLNFTTNYPSCGCSVSKRGDIKGKRCNKLLAISNLIFRLQGNSKYVRCICDCGDMANARLDRFLNQQCYACPKCNGDRIKKQPSIETSIGDKFGRLTVNSDRFKQEKDNWRCYWVHCSCECGVPCERRLTDLAHKKYLSCKDCGEKDRQATIINKLNRRLESYLTYHGCHIISSTDKVNGLVKYQCSCGLIIKRERRFLLVKMRTADRDLCKCKQIINGKKTSNPALELHSRLQGGFHNFDTKSGNVDIALRYNNKKIAIEYDEWWWHRKLNKRDFQKTQKLLNDGWFVLRIRASKGVVPSKEKIVWALDALIKTRTHLLILTHKTWRGYIND